MRLMRFRVRTLMILVALAALLLAAEKVYRHVSYCRSRAAWHAGEEAATLGRAALYDRGVRRLESLGRDPGHPTVRYAATQAAYNRGRAADHARLRQSFARAAVRPWLPLPREGVKSPARGL